MLKILKNLPFNYSLGYMEYWLRRGDNSKEEIV